MTLKCQGVVVERRQTKSHMLVENQQHEWPHVQTEPRTLRNCYTLYVVHEKVYTMCVWTNLAAVSFLQKWRENVKVLHLLCDIRFQCWCVHSHTTLSLFGHESHYTCTVYIISTYWYYFLTVSSYAAFQYVMSCLYLWLIHRHIYIVHVSRIMVLYLSYELNSWDWKSTLCVIKKANIERKSAQEVCFN
jgi:hypothetical protein